MNDKPECTCGSTLIKIGNNLVAGRQMSPNGLICPDCWTRCAECGNWYLVGLACPDHEDDKCEHHSLTPHGKPGAPDTMYQCDDCGTYLDSNYEEES